MNKNEISSSDTDIRIWNFSWKTWKCIYIPAKLDYPRLQRVFSSMCQDSINTNDFVNVIEPFSRYFFSIFPAFPHLLKQFFSFSFCTLTGWIGMVFDWKFVYITSLSANVSFKLLYSHCMLISWRFLQRQSA